MIGLLVNANARALRGTDALATRLRTQLGGRGLLVETRAPEEVGPALLHLRRAGASVIALVGGDGSHPPLLDQLLQPQEGRPPPPLALLRGGTMNTVARNFGIRGAPEKLLAQLLAEVEMGVLRTCRRQLIEVNGRFGFLFAAGMGARFLEVYYRNPQPHLRRALLVGARTLASALIGGDFATQLFQPIPIRMRVDGQARPHNRYRLLVAATVADVGLGMRVTFRAGETPGRFHLIASDLPMAALARQLPRVLGGRPLHGQPHLDELAASAQLHFDAPQPYTLDGDLFRAEKIEIRAGGTVEVVQPSRP
jgi:diacylglycerol kinase (ATP)